MCIRDRQHAVGVGAVRMALQAGDEIHRRALRALVPVSYTQLDVYKRQVYGNVLRFLYPLTIPDAQFDRALAILSEALAA